jgi:hypothetical protein
MAGAEGPKGAAQLLPVVLPKPLANALPSGTNSQFPRAQEIPTTRIKDVPVFYPRPSSSIPPTQAARVNMG